MTILYNCHTDGDQYRITKFNDGEVESSYLCTVDECECPAGHRPSCRHRHMLPRFIQKGAINSYFFYDYDRQGWVMNEPVPLTIATMHTIPDDADVAEEFAKLLHPEPAEERSSLPAPVPLPEGIQAYSMNDLSPAQLHNVIAEAIGEPTTP